MTLRYQLPSHIHICLLLLLPSHLISTLSVFFPLPGPLSFPIPPPHLILPRRNMNNTTPRSRCLGLTPQLVPVALDIVQAVRDHHHISAERAFDRAEIGGARSLLYACGAVNLVS